MSKAKTSEEFVYEQTAISKVFPIDYSEAEIMEMTGETRNKIRRWIMEESPMRTVLKDLVMYNSGEKYITSKGEKKKLPYPVETRSFLECYINLAKSKRYRNVFIDDSKKDAKNRFLREFCVQLCDTLIPYQEMPDASESVPYSDIDEFARHVIFGNATFAREVMEDLWENEFDKRVSIIRSRVRDLPYAAQAELMKTYLMVMDEWILGLHPTQKNKKRMDPETEIRKMFSELLSFRKKVNAGKKNSQQNIGQLAQYLIPNVTFSEKKLGTATNMQEAFYELSKRGDNCSVEMLDDIRKSYLQALSTNEVSDFEKKYIALHNYLLYDPQDSEKVKASFIDAMKQWGTVWINFCTADNDFEIPQTIIADTHLETLLQATAVNIMNSNWELIQQIRDLRLMYLGYKAGNKSAIGILNKQLDDLQKEHKRVCNVPTEPSDYEPIFISNIGMADALFSNTIRLLETVKKKIAKGKIVFINLSLTECIAADLAKSVLNFLNEEAVFQGYGEHTFTKRENLDIVARQFHDKAKAAAEFFEQPNSFRCTQTEIQEHLERCLAMSNAPKNELSLEEILRVIPPLVHGILLQRFHKLATDCDAVSMHRFMTSTTYA